jgi:hypothetical protein
LKRGSRVTLFPRSREVTMNTARAAAAFMFMFNIIEAKKKSKIEVRWIRKQYLQL